MDRIESFTGEYRWLSNFWPARVRYWGEWFTSVEHAYQAAKFVPHDMPRFNEIQYAKRPAEAKKLGQGGEIRPDWEEAKLRVMESLLEQKFTGAMAIKLAETGDAELIEGNWWGDTFWGVCEGKGENHLGKLLMKIRAELPHR